MEQLVKLKGNKVIFNKPEVFNHLKKIAEKEGKDTETIVNDIIKKYLKDFEKAQELIDYFFSNTASSCRAAEDGNCEVIDNGIDLMEVVKIMKG